MQIEYRPSPIDTDNIRLTDELTSLIERLAENAHDIWAAQRIADGWRFGPARCDKAREHPCLVPYERLPEGEKIYDRNAVLGTVQAILALGFSITRPDA